MSEKRKCNKYNYFDIFLLKVEILYLNFINIFFQNFLFRRIIKIVTLSLICRNILSKTYF
ncbi:hypothetical protein PFMC_05017 [Plasmodium falciparum CAMP/Malaysia]|uniref:Uncharacterized protein n=1 Tax=Plasmodium falciparum (isolate Camp / Malaysia) TaxID=5835 RepID=A0A024X2U6_PLAFC|nr:hypothetical protein PFMC_05017 [Plasmodium falciparum CAMP/Malaysia]